MGGRQGSGYQNMRFKSCIDPCDQGELTSQQPGLIYYFLYHIEFVESSFHSSTRLTRSYVHNRSRGRLRTCAPMSNIKCKGSPSQQILDVWVLCQDHRCKVIGSLRSTCLGDVLTRGNVLTKCTRKLWSPKLLLSQLDTDSTQWVILTLLQGGE